MLLFDVEVEGLHGDSDGGSGAGLEKNGVSYLRPTNSFKEKSHGRPSSAYVGSSTAQLPITPETQGDQLTSLQTPRRSLPTSNRVITEEGEQDGEPGLDLGHQTNITSNLSQSIESLDETDSVGYAGCDDNELGMLATEEPETWSCTADKKVLKRMNAKDIKRQDTIWELIQTERHHCKHLKILQRFYRDDMINDLKLTPKWVDQLFPRLDELIDIHMSFLRQLQDLQNKRPDHTIDEIGPVLEAQFSGESSDRMKEAYGAFCSGHLMAVQQYKEMLAKDRNFYIFIRKRADHIWCQKREIPDFILLITQRPTKYPTLVEAIIKSTKDKRDKDFLQRALINSKAVLHTVNERVAEAELQMRLQEIYAKTDTRSTGMKAGKKFKKYDLTGNSRRLLYEASMGWRNARGKYTDVIMLVLTDVIVFMQESNQKYVFFSQDNKFGVVSLFNLLVREKGDTRDSKGMYLISQNKQVPEMYELICRTASERLECIKKLRAALHQCPEEEDDIPTEAEEEKRKMEERNQRAKLIMESLQRKDEEIKAHCEEKNKLMLQLFSIYSGADELANTNSRPNSRDFDDAFEQSGTLQAAINEVSNAASQLTSMLQGSSNNLGRSVSSVGEYTSHGFTALPIPKRAETFAGSDTAYDLQKISKRRGIDTGDASESPGSSVYQADSECDLTQCADLPGPSKYDPSDVESGRGSSPGALSSISALSPGSGPGLEQSSLTQLLKTLNSIIYLTASQGTAVESLRAQLSEANERINKLSVDVHEKKSSGYRHNQLEELRNLQGQVQKEKQEWELQKDRESQKLEHERACFDELRRSLEQQEAEIRAQKEDLRKQREVLQKQTDMLQAQGKLPRNASVSGVDTSDQGIVQSNSEFQQGHRRSASLETFPSIPSSNSEQTSSSNKSVPKIPKESFRSESRPSITKLQSFSVGNKQNLPIHLLSATNEQKIGSKNVQKLPTKLSSSVSTSAVNSQHPHVLSNNTLRSSASGSASSHSLGGPVYGGSQGNVSHDLSGSTIPPPHDQYSQFGHSQSAGNLGNGGQVQGQTRVVLPPGSRVSNRPSPQSALGGLSRVMKLSEKGDKKGKGSCQGGSMGHTQIISPGPGATGGMAGHGGPSPQHLTEHHAGGGGQRPMSGGPDQRSRINHKPQKSDSDVIYF